MDRDNARRHERREARHRPEDDRDTRSRYDRDRSRSPPRFDRRDDRRRERTPPRPSVDRDTKPAPNKPRDRDNQWSREPPTGPSATRKHGDRHAARDAHDLKIPTGPARGTSDIKHRGNGATRMQQREDEDDEAYMARVMGFRDFKTTKNTQVPGNDKLFAVYRVKKNEYRQYMNRPGGFNRPLSPSRS